MAATFILADSARVRYATGAMMYFAQGIPQGLLAIAIPAWLASQGASASDIGSYLAVIVLPWAFKLLTGPLMDRYEFLAMGRRRPWVIGAQMGLSVSLLALMLVERPAEQVGLLMLIGMLINSFAATQDVATDGMSIDLTPIWEQGRLNAFMSFGKAIGWGATSAVSGVLLVTFGLTVTAIVAAAGAALFLLAMILVREREGERTLPWTSGEATSVHQPGNSFREVFGGINKVLWKRVSLIVMIIMFFDGLVVGYGQALMPVAAINLFGYTTPQWSGLVAMMGLIGAVVALGLGPLIDRFGAKRMLLLTVALVAVHAFMIAQTQHLWQNTAYVRVMLSLWVLLQPVTMVCVIALAMAICASKVSATQFAIYMSVANLGHSAGSQIYGMVAERTTYVENYTILGLFVVTMIVFITFHRHKVDKPATSGSGRRAAPQYTIGVGRGGAGLFWSGAMRCPKCRSDMEQIDYAGIEIDRCTTCKGIWFDAGEVDLLRNEKAAATIDIGDAREGREKNIIDHYRCPRCSGTMVRMVDPRQHHIWYETCGFCNGSFFDAGEFVDLSKFTIGDFFKSLSTPERT
jgi:PAT family beta-lactamase induction signal transducer AmpG